MHNARVSPVVSSPHRLDAFVASCDGMKSRAKARDLIEQGSVSVNGIVIRKPSYPLSEGDVVDLRELEHASDTQPTIEPVERDVHILYEDEVCIVVDKPRDYAVHPASSLRASDVTMLHIAAHLFAQRKIPFSPSEVLVHRLDKETTGCLLLAKTPEAHLFLQRQFADRTVEKEYVALVYGTPSPQAAVIDAPIGRHSADRTKMSVLHTGKTTRESRTEYRVEGSSHGASLLRCNLLTGRTHQIRVHLDSIGHPILGDAKYGTRASQKLAENLGIAFLCLHAERLMFRSPAVHDPVSVLSALPDEFASVLQAIALPLHM